MRADTITRAQAQLPATREELEQRLGLKPGSSQHESEARSAWNRRTPQPVVREPLSDAQIAEMMRDTWGCASIAPRHAMGFARAIEAEVRKQDDALIQQLADEAITAGRARLGRPHD